MTFLEVKICEWCHFRHTIRSPSIRRSCNEQIRELIAALRHNREPAVIRYRRSA